MVDSKDLVRFCPLRLTNRHLRRYCVNDLKRIPNQRRPLYSIKHQS